MNGDLIPIQKYDSFLEEASQAASFFHKKNVFKDYHEMKSQGTCDAQRKDLRLFSLYLSAMGVFRSPDDLYNDAEAWRGINRGLIEGFRQWLYYEQGERGYKVTSVNRCLATIRQYCSLSCEVGSIPPDDLVHIKAVKNHSLGNAHNIDQNRRKQGIEPSKGVRKEGWTDIRLEEFSSLKTVRTPHGSYRGHDQILEQRDLLLLCLLGEHGLRVGEVVGLNIGSIDLRRRKLIVVHFKTYDKDTLELLPTTELAAQIYLPLVSEKKENPLFTGYEGKRITRQALGKRIRQIGEMAGIQNLSPHDLRHFFTREWFERGEMLNMIQKYGGWKTGDMPLYYASLFGVEQTKPKILSERRQNENPFNGK